jgi:hypothetical protein
MPKGPWEDVAADYMGPLPSGEYLLVVIDYFSRFMEVDIVRTATSKATITHLRVMFARLGIPKTMKTDNGTPFTSIEMVNYCKGYGITLIHSTPRAPHQNGEVERMNRTLLKGLKISNALGRDWKKDMQDFLLMYRTTPHSVTGKSPAELLFGRKIRDKLPSIYGDTKNQYTEIQDRDKMLKQKGKEVVDRKRKAKPSGLGVGDLVVVRLFNKANKLSTNFGTEQFVIRSRKGTRVEVESTSTKARYDRHIDHLKQIQGANPLMQPIILDNEEPGDNVSFTPPDPITATDVPPGPTKRIRRLPKKLQDYKLYNIAF